IEHRRRLHEDFAQCRDRDFDRETARLPDAALHFLHALREMRLAGIQIAPGVEDADDRLAGPILLVIAHLLHARAMAKRTEIIRPQPSQAAELLRFLTRFVEV